MDISFDGRPELTLCPACTARSGAVSSVMTTAPGIANTTLAPPLDLGIGLPLQTGPGRYLRLMDRAHRVWSHASDGRPRARTRGAANRRVSNERRT